MYQVGNFKFKLNFHDEFVIPENLSLFKIDSNSDCYHYDIYVKENIDITEDSFILSKNNIKICKKNNLEKRYVIIPGDVHPYGMSEEIDNNHSIIYIHKKYVPMMIYDTMFVSLLCLERKVQNFNQYILHSSYMTINNKAILFTAPSGTGKSTQADLWMKYRGSEVMNGDRSLLVKEDKYYAYGWPICGSSEICNNKKYPITCIVVLSQAKVNKIEELSYKDSFKKILSELTINYHNPLFVNCAMDFIDDLVKNVKIYHLACDISEDAVKCLENKLKEDDLWML